MYILDIRAYSLIIIIISGIFITDSDTKKVLKCSNENCTKPIFHTQFVTTYQLKSGTTVQRETKVPIFGISDNEWLLKYLGKCDLTPIVKLSKTPHKSVNTSSLVSVIWNDEKCNLISDVTMKEANSTLNKTENDFDNVYPESNGIKSVNLQPDSVHLKHVNDNLSEDKLKENIDVDNGTNARSGKSKKYTVERNEMNTKSTRLDLHKQFFINYRRSDITELSECKVEQRRKINNETSKTEVEIISAKNNGHEKKHTTQMNISLLKLYNTSAIKKLDITKKSTENDVARTKNTLLETNDNEHVFSNTTDRIEDVNNRDSDSFNETKKPDTIDAHNQATDISVNLMNAFESDDIEENRSHIEVETINDDSNQTIETIDELASPVNAKETEESTESNILPTNKAADISANTGNVSESHGAITKNRSHLESDDQSKRKINLVDEVTSSSSEIDKSTESILHHINKQAIDINANSSESRDKSVAGKRSYFDFNENVDINRENVIDFIASRTENEPSHFNNNELQPAVDAIVNNADVVVNEQSTDAVSKNDNVILDNFNDDIECSIQTCNENERKNIETVSQYPIKSDVDDDFSDHTLYSYTDDIEKKVYNFLNSVDLLYRNSLIKLNGIFELINRSLRRDSENISLNVVNEFSACSATNNLEVLRHDGVNCCVDDSCDKLEDKMKYSSQAFASINSESTRNDVSFITMNYYIYSAFVAFIIFVCSALYYNLQKRSLDYKLVMRINELESRLFVLNKEIVSLEENNEQINEINTDRDNNVKRDDSIHKEDDVLEKLQDTNVQLGNKVSYLERELERVTSSALEIHQLLENALLGQQEVQALEEQIKELGENSRKQMEIVDSLKKQNENLTLENEILKQDNNEMIKRVEKVRSDYNVQRKQNAELTEKCDSLQLRLDQQLETFSTNEEMYKREMVGLRKAACNLELSLEKAEVNLEKLKSLMKNNQSDGWIDEDESAEMKSQLANLQTLQWCNKKICEELSIEKSARLSLEDTVRNLNNQIKMWKEKCDVLEKEKRNLDVKLEVLTDYFNEKEVVFRKEVEAKESTWSKQQTDQLLLSHKYSLLQTELDDVKSQNEILRKEILEQEKSFKTQLTNAEEKSRERWFALRQAERKYKECEQEAATLRNRLLMLESNMSGSSSKIEVSANAVNLVNGMIVNGLSSELYPANVYSSSEFLSLPPPPLLNNDMEVFPPEPLYSPERLSPLGGGAAGARRPLSPPPPLIDDDYDDDEEFVRSPSFSRQSRNTNANTLDSISSLSTYRSTPPSSRRKGNHYRTRHRNMDQDSISSGLSETSLDKEIIRR